MGNLVSIAMTTYNGEKYLEEQLNSIIFQTYKDFELVICDDGSTDKTMRILTKYALQDNRIKVFQNIKKLGYAENFMHAFNKCNGKYVFFSDQDDIWGKNKLSLMIDCMERNQQINVLISYDIDFYDRARDALPEINNQTMSNKTIMIPKKKSFLSCAYRGCNMCIRKSWANQIIQDYDSSIPYPAHDWFFQVFATENNSIYLLNKVLNYHRLHDKNTSNLGENTSSRHSKRLSILERIIIHYKWALDVVHNEKAKDILNTICFYNLERYEFLANPMNFKSVLKFLNLFAYASIYHLPIKRLLGDFLFTFLRSIKHEK